LLLAQGNFNGTVSVYTVAANGELSLVGPPGGEPTGGTGVNSVAFSPNGHLLVVANNNSGFGGTVAVFTVAAGGTLEKVGEPVPTGGAGPNSVAFSPAGGLLATGNSGNSVSFFTVNEESGALQSLGEPIITGGGSAAQVVFSPDPLIATANATSTVSVLAETGPLQIGKVADRSEIAPGGTLTYTLTVKNPNPHVVVGAVSDDLSDVLDKATLEGTPSADTGTLKPVANDQLEWEGSLAPGAEAIIKYSVKVDASAHGDLFNGVTGPPGSTCKAPMNPDQPCKTVTPIVPPDRPGPDLELTKTASTQTVHPGGQVTYTLAVHNRGPGEAKQVELEDPVPSGIFFYQARTGPPGSCTITRALHCTLGELPAGGSAVVLVTANVSTVASGSIENVATVWDKAGDPNGRNNTARSTIQVVPLPRLPTSDPGVQPVSELSVSKHVDHLIARVGQRLTYTISVINSGPDSATDVRVTDASRLPLRVLSIHPGQGSCQKGPPITCALGTLPAHGQTTVTIVAVATVAGAHTNTVALMSASWDPDPRISIANARTRILRARVRRPPRPPAVTG
jgi:uncharacterized repeat protein (TIGR01451 family)